MTIEMRIEEKTRRMEKGNGTIQIQTERNGTSLRFEKSLGTNIVRLAFDIQTMALFARKIIKTGKNFGFFSMNERKKNIEEIR